MNEGRIVVLSDLHVWGPEDPLYRALLRFLDEKLERGDTFFIVGDLFDLFVGNKKVFRERFHELIGRLRGLGARGVAVYYVEGNHDFQIESLFEDCPHVRIYSDSVHLDWDGRRFHVAHGDRVNWKDVSYQAFRLLTRNLLTHCLIEAVPGAFIDRLGGMMSKVSRTHHAETDERTVRLFRNYACERISAGYDFVVLGHSHFPDDMRFRVGSHEGQYVNCGYPRKHRKYFVLRKGQPFFEARSLEDIVVPIRPAAAGQ